MHIQEAQDPIRWNEFIKNHPESTYYHLYEWKWCLESTYSIETLYLEAIDDNKIVGVFPVALAGLKVFLHIAVSLPFCNYGGPLVILKDVENALINKAKNIIRSRYRNVKGIELRKIKREPKSQSNFVTMIRELLNNSEVLWKTLRTKERNQVRKAEKSGLKIRYGKEYLDEFYQIYAKNMHRLGTPVHSKRWFSHILDTMDDQTDLITVWLESTPIAGMLIFKFKDSISDPYASTLKGYNPLCPNALMYWGALKFGCENGFKYFDFGRSSVGSSTFKFKKHWGGHSVPLNYEFISFGNKPNLTSENKYTESKALLAAKCWSKIPYSISLWLGPKIRKYIP